MIDLTKAKYHLRIDGTGDDIEITTKLVQAQAIVNQYLGAAATDTLDSGAIYNGEPPMIDPPMLVSEAATDAAVLLVLGELFANREGSGATPLSPSVRAILDLVRGPVFA